MLPALLSACVPAPLQTQPGSDVTLTAQLSTDELKVGAGAYRRPGPAQLQVQVAASSATYLYALLLPDQQAAQLLTPQRQPVEGQVATFNVPAVSGYTQLFVVGSLRPLKFGPLGSSAGSLAQALSAATAGLPTRSWNVTTQVFRVGEYGALRVISDPAEASVYVNGTYRGTTPLSLGAVPAGKVTLRLERPGFGALIRSVTVIPTRPPKFGPACRPRPAVGRLTVHSSVAAQVQLVGPQGEWRGNAPLNAEFPAGDYDLTVTPLDSPLKAAWVGFTLGRDQILNVTCAPDGGQLSCQLPLRPA